MKSLLLVALFAAAAFAAVPQSKGALPRGHDHNGTVALQGCDCTYSYWSYEISPIALNGGAGCIGGCGGGSFNYHRYGTTVKTLEVWSSCAEHDGICAVGITYFDGSKDLIGVPKGSNYKAFTFKPAEFLTSWTLSGNGIGTRLGYISFTTNAGNSFAAGNDGNTKYVFNVNNAFLSGLYGRSGLEVDMLGVLVYKPVKSTKLNNINYPSLDSIVSGLNPQTLTRFNLCNGTPLQQESPSPSFSKTEGEHHCWSVSATISFEVSTSVEAGVPEVAKTSVGYKWGVSASASYEQCKDTSTTTSSSVKIQQPPMSRTTAVITQWVSPINVPYNADYQIYFDDGTSATFATSGFYEGVYLQDFQQQIQSTPLNPGEQCTTGTTTREAATISAP